MPRFIADVHLGKLARMLRLLGFDVLYKNDWRNDELTNIANAEERILLSRNAAYQKSSIAFQHILSEEPETQLAEVLKRFDLFKRFAPLSRCSLCNGFLEDVAKETVLHKIPEQTARWYDRFWQCSGCGKVYWKGAHYNRIKELIEKAERGGL